MRTLPPGKPLHYRSYRGYEPPNQGSLYGTPSYGGWPPEKPPRYPSYEGYEPPYQRPLYSTPGYVKWPPELPRIIIPPATMHLMESQGQAFSPQQEKVISDEAQAVIGRRPKTVSAPQPKPSTLTKAAPTQATKAEGTTEEARPGLPWLAGGAATTAATLARMAMQNQPGMQQGQPIQQGQAPVSQPTAALSNEAAIKQAQGIPGQGGEPQQNPLLNPAVWKFISELGMAMSGEGTPGERIGAVGSQFAKSTIYARAARKVDAGVPLSPADMVGLAPEEVDALQRRGFEKERLAGQLRLSEAQALLGARKESREERRLGLSEAQARRAREEYEYNKSLREEMLDLNTRYKEAQIKHFEALSNKATAEIDTQALTDTDKVVIADLLQQAGKAYTGKLGIFTEQESFASTGATMEAGMNHPSLSEAGRRAVAGYADVYYDRALHANPAGFTLADIKAIAEAQGLTLERAIEIATQQQSRGR